MSDHENASSDSEYQYSSDFFYFYNSLKVLAMEAHEQCEAMGNFNVAWELKDDVLSLGSFVLRSDSLRIEVKDRERVHSILSDLRLIPKEVIDRKNLDAMEDPVWIPLRSQSRDLIQSLTYESERTNLVLWPGGTGGSF